MTFQYKVHSTSLQLQTPARLFKLAMISLSICSALNSTALMAQETLANPVANEVSAETKRFNIPTQSMNKALIEFTRQSRAQVVLSQGVSITDLESSPLVGAFSTQQALAILLGNSGLVAQATSSGDFLISMAKAEKLDPPVEVIVVTATRSEVSVDDLPQIVTVISKQQIEQQLKFTSDTSQILSNLLPAFAPNRQKLTNGGETFRGRTPLFLIDGVPQSNPLRAAGRAGHTIDLSVVERIEVIHGASAIHGLGATGGIINYITRKPTGDDFKQHISLQSNFEASGSESDTLGYKGSYRMEGNSDELSYLFGVSYQDQGVYLDANGDLVGVDNTQGDLMDSETYDVFAKLGYWFNDEQHLSVELNRYHSEGKQNYVSVAGDRANGVPSTSVKGTPIGLAPRNQVLTSSISYTDKDFYGMALSAQLYSQKFEGRFGATLTNTFQDENIAPFAELYDQSQTSSDKLGAKITLNKDGLFDDKLSLTTGIDLLKDTTKQTLELTSRTWVPESEFNNYAPFLQAELRPIESVVLHAGVRHEEVKLDVDSFQTIASANGVTVNGGSPEFNETLFSAGAVVDVSDNFSLFLNRSEGFGMPDVGRVLRGINQPNLDVDEFLNLEPILTKNTDIGFRGHFTNVNFELSYYQSNSDLGSRLRLIDDVFFVSRQRTEIKGYEALINIDASKDHKLTFAYSNITGEFDGDGDGQVDSKLTGQNIAPNRLIATWNANWSENLSSTLRINHAFDRNFDVPELEFNGYSLVDISVAYVLPKGQLSLAINNTLNKDYITYYSQSALVNNVRYFSGRGRNASLTYSLDF